jgi:hypothetical protein
MEAHRLARLAADDLRARAMRNDTTVTASALAAANDEAAFAELGIEAKKTATVALDSELRTAKAEQFANEFSASIQPLRQEFDQSLVDLESALGVVVTAWRAHATSIDRAYQTAARVHHTATPRIRFPQYGNPSIDKTELRAIEVFGPVQMLVEKTLAGLNARL